jgi:DNA-damage-inducible protein D
LINGGDYIMNKTIKNYNIETFEDIKHIDENGFEFWYAREL